MRNPGVIFLREVHKKDRDSLEVVAATSDFSREIAKLIEFLISEFAEKVRYRYR